jgi:hypothetical protein
MTPKEKFKASDHAKGWNTVVDGRQFQFAADSAMFQFLSSLNKPDGIESAAANEYRRQGAQAYRDFLENLNSETNKTSHDTRANLAR